MVRPEFSFAVIANNHWVGESGHMAACFPHFSRRENTGIQKRHVIMILHGLSPFVDYISAKLGSEWSPIVCSRESAVYFRTREDKSSPLAKRYYFSSLFSIFVISRRFGRDSDQSVGVIPLTLSSLPLDCGSSAKFIVKAGISAKIFLGERVARFHDGFIYQNRRFSHLGKVAKRNLKRYLLGLALLCPVPAGTLRHSKQASHFFSSNCKSASSGL